MNETLKVMQATTSTAADVGAALEQWQRTMLEVRDQSAHEVQPICSKLHHDVSQDAVGLAFAMDQLQGCAEEVVLELEKLRQQSLRPHGQKCILNEPHSHSALHSFAFHPHFSAITRHVFDDRWPSVSDITTYRVVSHLLTCSVPGRTYVCSAVVGNNWCASTYSCCVCTSTFSNHVSSAMTGTPMIRNWMAMAYTSMIPGAEQVASASSKAMKWFEQHEFSLDPEDINEADLSTRLVYLESMHGQELNVQMVSDLGTISATFRLCRKLFSSATVPIARGSRRLRPTSSSSRPAWCISR